MISYIESSLLIIYYLLISTIHVTKSTNTVTCNSVLKLYNPTSNVRLHSHDIKYGSGSGQQSVTGIQIVEDVNSHWMINGPLENPCVRGEDIKCGDIIRLQHLTTSKNLHSHVFHSPLSANQEVSCYGSDGIGDSGDEWQVRCEDEVWKRDEFVKFLHVDTRMYLSATDNVFGRPINGQREIVCLSQANPESSIWKAAEGIYMNKSERLNRVDSRFHTEL